MTILPISDIKGLNSTIYLNETDGEKLFFTDASENQHYFLMRDSEVIANGVMRGYQENGVYNYRFDFSKYIRIYNQEAPNFIPLYRADVLTPKELERINAEIERLTNLGANNILYNTSDTYRALSITGYRVTSRSVDIITTGLFGGDVFTYSAELDTTNSTNNVAISVRFLDSKEREIRRELSNSVPMGGVYKAELTTTVPNGTHDIVFFIDNHPYASVTTPVQVSIRKEKIERGSTSTKWTESRKELQEKLDATSPVRFSHNNESKLYLYLSNTESLSGNISSGRLRKLPDGSVRLSSGTYSNLTAQTKVFPTFIDATSTSPYRMPKEASVDHYIPITLLGTFSSFRYRFRDKNNATLFYSLIFNKTVEQGADVYLLKAYEGTTVVEITLEKDGVSETIIIRVEDDCNLTPYYFWNINGGYDTILCRGIARDVVNVDKKYININGKDIPLRIDIDSKVTHNTGFGLNSEQIYSLIKSPNVNRLEFNAISPINHIMNIDDESFNGYNGTNLSERNIELTFSKPTQSRRVTNKRITFFD